jgi:hypothetical protein
MKRLVIITEEIDGHSQASSTICTTKQAYENLIKSMLYFQGELLYEFSSENKANEKDTTHYYRGDSGEMAIRVILFNSYVEISNKEFLVRTG